ncbi:MAG: NAD(+) diphosphatase [Desulfuromonadales bacterium]|nr:NAD(+) diphosphatase [Desulfuromonadales bacterium]
MLPHDYASATHLPFNAAALHKRLDFRTPDRDPGGAGSLLLLQDSSLLLNPAAQLFDSTVVTDTLGSPPLYIGQWDGRPCRVARSLEATPPHGAIIAALLSPEPQLPIDLLSLGALGRQILLWERHSRFCGKCGKATRRIDGHWGVRCSACNFERFPDLHPCVIVLIRRADELLLVRKAEWQPGRYGLVAGFLDLGECLEEAVAREVAEETGIRVENVHYAGSQAWPFPSQLMTGFRADYAGGEVCAQDDELEEARWFALDKLPTLPPKRSIARYLIDREVGRR